MSGTSSSKAAAGGGRPSSPRRKCWPGVWQCVDRPIASLPCVGLVAVIGSGDSLSARSSLFAGRPAQFARRGSSSQCELRTLHRIAFLSFKKRALVFWPHVVGAQRLAPLFRCAKVFAAAREKPPRPALKRPRAARPARAAAGGRLQQIQPAAL